MHYRLVFILICIFTTSIANAETGKPADKQHILAGKKLYEKHCINCHQKDGVGEDFIPDSIRRPGFVTAMPLNETSHAWHHSDEQLADAILKGLRGNGRMPAFKGKISSQDANNLVAYIKSLWSPRIIACQGPKHMSCM